jgi:hypothetical protein
MKQVAMEASAGHVKRSAANKESIQAIDKQMDALVDRLACTQALLEDVQYTSAKTAQRSLPLCSRPLWT